MKVDKDEIIVFFKQNSKTMLWALVISIILFCGVIYFFGSSKTEDYSDTNFAKETKEISQEKTSEVSKKIFVDVKGAVKKPGVYETTNEKRVKDIIDEAGGLLEDADTSNINLSQKLKDQMVINILKKGEKSKNKDSSTDNFQNENKEIININTADKDQLMKISGVGKTKAEAIISYREKNGEFKNKEEITKVKGIGKATYEKIKENIEV
ncbi:helix-hairpin-helix domain-containing protein [Gemella bergeri]